MNRRILIVSMLTLCSIAAAFSQRIRSEGSNIPPNYGYYTLNPEYTGEPQTLGWATERIEEKLDRGMVAVNMGDGKVYLSWRLLKDDPEDIAFNIYRFTIGKETQKLNKQLIHQTTDFMDKNVQLNQENAWWVRPVVKGKEQADSGWAVLPANAPVQQYKAIKLKDDVRPKGVHKIGIGDLDGDGEYDFVVKRPDGVTDPGQVRQSSTTFKVEAYKSDGTFMWRNDLGWSIEMGTWYSPMVVYDFDGDGKAEVAIKTGEGDPRNEKGQVITGPEYFSVWDGETGKEIARADWIPRGESPDWGDTSYNRMNRNMMGVAYLDGKTPAILILRGIYGLQKMEAWYLKDNQLHRAWKWSNATSGWKYQGQGQHSIHVADIDGDGCDEILNGSIAVDNDGRIMWSTGLGHGDRFYISDINPAHPGLEVWYCYEDPHPQNGVSLWDARTGDLLWGTREETKDDQVDRCLAADIDPNYPGMECWGDKFYFTAGGEPIPGDVPPTDGLVWWDADPLREIERRGQVYKWQGPVLTDNIKGRARIWADILGDWREEIITYYGGELRIYTTVIPAADRRACLMQDPIYRFDVAFKAMGYDLVPMTSYYLGVTK